MIAEKQQINWKDIIFFIYLGMTSSEAWAIENLQSLRETFRIFDRQDCGQVRRQDLELAIKQWGEERVEQRNLQIDISEEELDYIMHEVSHQTGKKQFDFDEFLLIMVRKESFSYSAGKVIEAFKLLDNSNDGQISRKVLSEILRGIPKGDDTEMNEAEIEELIKGVLEKNEKADKNEKMYNQQNSMYEKSDKNDKEKDDETLDYNKLVNTVMTMLQ